MISTVLWKKLTPTIKLTKICLKRESRLIPKKKKKRTVSTVLKERNLPHQSIKTWRHIWRKKSGLNSKKKKINTVSNTHKKELTKSPLEEKFPGRFLKKKEKEKKNGYYCSKRKKLPHQLIKTMKVLLKKKICAES